jgi:hypothetical protein
MRIVAEVNAIVTEGPKNKYERLENRISLSTFLDLIHAEIFLTNQSIFCR